MANSILLGGFYSAPNTPGLFFQSKKLPIDAELCYANDPDNLFRKYNYLVTWFANNPLGRDYLGIPPVKEKIGLLAQNGYHLIVNTTPEKLAVYFELSNEPIYNPLLLSALQKVDRLQYQIRSFDEAKQVLLWATGLDKSSIPTLARQILFSQFNPNAGGSGSGRLQSSNTSFGTASAGSGLTLVTSISQLLVSLSGSTYTIDRIFHPFDTSSLPDAAGITSSFIRYVGTADNNNADNIFLSPVQSVQSSFTTLATSDWNNIGSVLYGGFTKALWNQSGNNDVILNSDGIGNISLTGYSGFACRTDRDVSGTQPTGVNVFGISSVGTIVLDVQFTTTSTSTSTSTTTTSTSTTTTSTSTSTTTTSTSTSTSTTHTTSTSTTTTSTSTSTSSSTTITVTSTSTSSSTSTSTSTTTTFPLGFEVDSASAREEILSFSVDGEQQ
jgi:hypothetical protein